MRNDDFNLNAFRPGTKSPEGSLFNEFNSFMPCRSAASPFQLSSQQIVQIREIGEAIASFYKAQNAIYLKSVSGEAPAWIHEYLDNGKPDHMVQLGRTKRFRRDLPKLLRPDLLITDSGFTLCELDTVPGGFGLTSRIADVYRHAGYELTGDISVEEGFISTFMESPEGTMLTTAIVVSDESQDYLNEMKWLSQKIRTLGYEIYTVHPRELYYCEDYVAINDEGRLIKLDTIYRFMELFDHINIPKWDLMIYLAKGKRIQVTPPVKAYLEEKLWFALFHHPLLESYWENELGCAHFSILYDLIPHTWVLDPAPLPPQATIHGLQLDGKPVQSWEVIKNASRRNREFVVKPSGYSELAWGSRGVTIGHDVSSTQWTIKLENALTDFLNTTYILQEFYSPTRTSLPVYKQDSGEIISFEGRVRITPYYFVVNNQIKLSNVLATICSSDKKKIHGMSDAVMTVCSAGK